MQHILLTDVSIVGPGEVPNICMQVFSVRNVRRWLGLIWSRVIKDKHIISLEDAIGDKSWTGIDILSR